MRIRERLLSLPERRFLPMWANANDLQTDTFARKDSAVAGCVEEARPASLRTYRPALSYLSGSLARPSYLPTQNAEGPFFAANAAINEETARLFTWRGSPRDLVDQADRVVGEQCVRAARERQMVLHVAVGLLRVQTGDRVAHTDPLVQRRERALAQTATKRGLPEQQQTERGDLIHPHIRQTADALKALSIEEMRFIDDHHDVLATLRSRPPTAPAPGGSARRDETAASRPSVVMISP